MRVSKSKFSSSTGLIALAIGLSIAPLSAAQAQSAAPDIAQADDQLSAEDYDEYDLEDTIIVFGKRLLGSVDAPQPPILELGVEEIAAYGSGSIAELLQALSPQTGSARGRGGGGPALLVNGVRISSFREMRSYPPEAIEKIEVFSEEVAQRYGFSPDQRVINIILKDNFSSRIVEVEYSQPSLGGYSSQGVDATYLLLNGPSRLNFNVEWGNRSILTEAERGITQTVSSDLASDPDPAEYRSLISDTAGFGLTGNWTTRIDDKGNSLSLNASYERDDSLSLQGLNTAFLTDPLGASILRTIDASNPLETNRRSQSFAGGSTLNLGVGDWQVTGTLDGQHNFSRNLIDIFGDTSGLVTDAAAGTLALDGDLGSLVDAGFDEAVTKTDSISSKLTARGNPVYLPGGEVSLTFDAGYNWNRIQSRDTRNPGVETSLTRGRLSSGVNLGIPITSRDEDFGGAIGNISLNFSGGIDHLSDFGTLYDWTAGLNWGPTEWLNLSASYIVRDAAPSLSQLGSPEVATLNVPVFDLSRNETVLITQISGGNQNLPSQTQKDWKFGAQIALPFFDQASISVDYIRNHSDDVATGFPTLSSDIEAAFPDRIVRDGFGQLVSIDRRAVTFAEQDVERIQFGLNLSGQIGGDGNNERRGGFGGRPGGGGPGGGGGGPPGGFRGPPPGAFGGGPPASTPASGTPAAGGDAASNGADSNGAPAGSPTGGPPGGAGGGFAAMRTLLCGENGDEVFTKLAAGETVTADDGQEVTLPSFMLDRIRDENGEVNEEMAGRIRERMCSADGPSGPPAGAGGAQGGAQGGGPQGGAPQGGATPQAGGAPQGGGGFGGFGRGRGGGGGGRWFFNLQYTRELQNETLISDGGLLLDLLDGDALSGGGQAKHSANARIGVFYGGFGTFITGNYNGASRLDGSGLAGSTNLKFHDYATINLRSFVNLGQQESLVAKFPILENVRLGIEVNNIFDARQTVTDSNGDVPLRYQPLLIDPVGRSFEIEIRKMF